MVRVLHAAAGFGETSGISRQMQAEQDAAQEITIPWVAKLFRPSDPDTDTSGSVVVTYKPKSFFRFSKLLRWLELRGLYFRWLISESRGFDLILLRHSVHDPFQVLFLLLRGNKTILVHHTKEVDEMLSFGGFYGRVRGIAETITGYFSIRQSVGLVAVTDEILEHESRRVGGKDGFAFTYPNGIRITQPVVEDRRDETPKLLFVASTFAPWHGLDLLLDSAITNSGIFRIDLVGEVPRDLIARVKEDKRIVWHGTRTHQEIRDLAAEAWLGVSSLAANRKNLRQGCALKVRDYLAWGLPTVGSYEEVFPSSFPFYVQVKPDINVILQNAHRFREVERSEVLATSKPHISKEALLMGLWESISDSFAKPN